MACPIVITGVHERPVVPKEVSSIPDSVNLEHLARRDEAVRRAESQAQMLGCVLEEYKALRAEITQLMDKQYFLVYWAISAVLLLIIALGTTWGKLGSIASSGNSIIPCALMLLVPVLTLAFTTSWSYVITNIARLGAHLFLLERKAAALVLGRGNYLPFEMEMIERIPISWEHALWREGSQVNLRRAADMVLWPVAGILTCTIVVGAILLDVDFWRPGLPIAGWQSGLSVTSMVTWSFAWVRIRTSVHARIDSASAQMIRYRTAVGPINSLDESPRSW